MPGLCLSCHWNRCEELGLIKYCKDIPVREATESELLSKHSPEQIEILRATENVSDEDYLEKLSSKYDAIYIHPVSSIPVCLLKKIAFVQGSIILKYSLF